MKFLILASWILFWSCTSRPTQDMVVNTEVAGDRAIAAEDARKLKYGSNVPMLTNGELDLHRSKMNEFMKIASACVQDHLEEHQAFHEKYGVSNYIGVNTRIIVGGKQVPLKSHWKEGQEENKLRSLVTSSYKQWKSNFKKKSIIEPEDIAKISNMSCIGMAIRCMKKAFSETQQDLIYQKLITYYRNPGKQGIQAYTGHPLLLGLQQGLGWKIAYWNPNPSTESLKWMDTEPGDPPFRNHAKRYEEVIDKKTYYGIPVDIMLVGESSWGKDHREVPELLKKTPFGLFGTTDFYHVGPFSNGVITEAHAGMMWFAQNSTAGDFEKSKRVIESNPFSPFADGGAPRGHYPTGIVAIPPM